MDIIKKILKINEKVGVRIFSDKIDFFDNEKVVNIKGRDTKNFRKYILPFLFEGISEKDLAGIAVRYNKKSLFNFIDKLIYNGILEASTNNRYSLSSLDGGSRLLRVDEEIWETVDCVIINPKEAKGYENSFFIVSSRYKVKKGRKNYYYWSTGADIVFAQAYLKSVFEAVERSYNSLKKHYKVVRLPYSRVKNYAIDPRDIVAYKDKQYIDNFPYKKFKENDIFQWVSATSYFSGEEKLIIVDEVYYPLSEIFLKRKKYTSANSSGSSAHFHKKDAIQNALYELIERDSFMISWLNRLPVPKININSVPKNIKKRIKELEAKGFSVSIFDITLDIGPVFLAIIHSVKQGFAAFLGAGSGQNKTESIDKALREAETLLFFAYKHSFVPIKKENVKTPIDHGMYYRNIKNLKNLSFLLRSKETVNFNNRSDDKILEKMKKKNMKMFSVGLCKKLKDESDINVVKVFVPSLVPITFGYKKEPLGMKRINEVPMKLGFNVRNNIDTSEPHPFA